MTVLPRAATSPELVKLRSDNQSTRLYLTVHSPATVYTARLAAVPASTDKVESITYNTGSGTLANVLQDMTLLVGSSAGASDYGLARIRKDGTTLSGTFYIGETSEINWQSNAYLTVVDEFGLWPRHIRISPTDGTTPLMDYDVAYTDQNQAAGSIPTPIMGPHAVLWLRGASVTYSPDASSSWVNGGTIAAYSWACTGASISGGTTATPTITFTSAGTYRLALTVTGDNAVTFTGYRRVFVLASESGATTQFTLESCNGDYDTGGWSYRVTLYAEATKALIRDRALCILHAVDYYGSSAGSVGYVAGCENVIAVGWIAGETIQWATQDKAGSVSFEVQGPHYWLGQMTAFPSGVKDVSDATTPNKWTKFRGLTLNKAWYHFMRWRCTATRCMDVYPNTDTRRHKRLEAPGGQNIWAQLIEIGKRSMLADPCCDRYGRIFLQINHQFVSDRSGFATVQAITSQDWRDQIDLERVTVDRASLIDMSGIAWDGTTPTPFFSLAPGHVFNHYGSVEVVDRLMLTDQTSTNTLAGLYSAWRNNPYPKVDVKLGANHRLIDLAPYQRVTLAIASTDTPRGITESLTLIPRSISFNSDNRAGYLLTDATFEAEVTADLAVTGDTPPQLPDPPDTPIDPPIDPPPIDDSLPSDAREIWIGGTRSSGDLVGLYWSSDFFAGGQPTWHKVASVPTLLQLRGWCVSLDGSAVYLIGRDGANIHTDSKIWRCTNPKAFSPTWTVIADNTTAVAAGYGFYTEYGSHINEGMLGCYGTTLYCYTWGWNGSTSLNYLVYGEYASGAWTWTTINVPFSSRFSYRAFARTVGGGSYTAYSIPPLATVYNGSGITSFHDIHRYYAGSVRELIVKSTATTVYRIRDVSSTSESLSGSLTGATSYRGLSGSTKGTRLFAVMNPARVLYVSDADADFAIRGSVIGTFIHDAKLTGGGPLVDVIGQDSGSSPTSTGSEFARISRNGTGSDGTWEAMTGDFWTTVEPSISSVTFYRPANLVF